MNDSTIPPQNGQGAQGTDGSGSSGQAHSGPVHGGPHAHTPPPSNGFFQWIRGLGIVRDASDRWFAGVASGLAHKARIDPLIARGVFVVLALLGGPGLLLYLFGWLFLPDHTGKIHMEDLLRGRSTPGVIIGTIVIVVWIFAGIFSPWEHSLWNWGIWGFAGVPDAVVVTFTVLFWLAVAGGIAYLVHRAIVNHGNEQRAHMADTTAPTEPTGFTESAQHAAHDFGRKAEDWGKDFSQKAETWGRDFGEKANAWGKDIGAKTDAWSVEYARHYEQTHMPKGQLFISLALALITGAVTFFWLNHTGAPSTGTFPSAIAGDVLGGFIAATVVLALSMIIAGVRGRRSGPVGFFALIGVLAILLTVAMPWGSRYTLFGNQHVGVGAPGVAALAGNITVDLTEFDDAPHDHSLVVTQVFGNIDVALPEDRPTQVNIRVTAGRIHLTEQGRTTTTEVISSGVLTNRTFTFNQGETGEPLTVTVNLAGGNVDLIYDPDTVQNSTPQHILRGSR